jgi:hypothetical protein
MQSNTKSPHLLSLLSMVKTLRRAEDGPKLSPAERAARISRLVEDLASYSRGPVAAQPAPMTRSAEER